MAFTQFPHQQYFRALDSDTNTGLGYFNLGDGTELKHVMATILQVGIIASPYQLRMNLYASTDTSSPAARSDWATISAATLEPTYATNWLGNIYFDFDGESLNPNINYYMYFETLGYTRVGDTYYLGINLDWYSPVNTQVSMTEAGARIRILGERVLAT